jgi:hypothetical protein
MSDEMDTAEREAIIASAGQKQARIRAALGPDVEPTDSLALIQEFVARTGQMIATDVRVLTPTRHMLDTAGQQLEAIASASRSTRH